MLVPVPGHSTVLSPVLARIAQSHAPQYVYWLQSSDLVSVAITRPLTLQIADLVNKYKVDAYINGHDHTMTHSDPAHAGKQWHGDSGRPHLLPLLPVKQRQCVHAVKGGIFSR